jgi:hypothetical protein
MNEIRPVRPLSQNTSSPAGNLAVVRSICVHTAVVCLDGQTQMTTPQEENDK